LASYSIISLCPPKRDLLYKAGRDAEAEAAVLPVLRHLVDHWADLGNNTSVISSLQVSSLNLIQYPLLLAVNVS
jgi:hypothetical protein